MLFGCSSLSSFVLIATLTGILLLLFVIVGIRSIRSTLFQCDTRDHIAAIPIQFASYFSILFMGNNEEKKLERKQMNEKQEEERKKLNIFLEGNYEFCYFYHFPRAWLVHWCPCAHVCWLALHRLFTHKHTHTCKSTGGRTTTNVYSILNVVVSFCSSSSLLLLSPIVENSHL